MRPRWSSLSSSALFWRLRSTSAAQGRADGTSDELPGHSRAMGRHNAHEHSHFALRASFAGDLTHAIRSQPDLLLRLEWPQQPPLTGARLKQEAIPRLDARNAVLVTKDDDLGAIRN